jgi:predicted hydrocarbon binding protein
VLTNCLGWGKIIKHNLDEDRQELEITVDSSYYIHFWLAKYRKPDYPICHMWTGTAAGYMDVLFGQKVHDFVGEEVTCAARDGGTQCVFQARRVKKKFGLS